LKTASYNLKEEQIEYVKQCAKENGQSSDSAALRTIIDASMQRRVVVAKGANGRVRIDESFASQQQVSTSG
jgi:hypothetical protein